MCGIAGAINLKNECIEDIKKSLYHRGPDEQTSFIDKNIFLIHSRLSIQDISEGHQPFEFKDYIIVFNGEIYNHMRLRKNLREFNFRTKSDTETLLYLFIKYKEKMFDMIDGMFAFCIYDKKSQKMFLSKDRSGKKPLYIYKKNNQLLFASEINSIRVAIPNLEIEEDAIESYLRTGFFFRDNTAYKNVFNLKAGSFCIIDVNSLQLDIKEYFNIVNFYERKNNLSFEESLDKVDKLLHRSVKDRLESSDLEVGAFLSGGIDSSLVVAIASEYKDKLKTFTVKFEDGYDESHLAKLTANKYNTEHSELKISMNLKDDIEMIINNYGQPFMDSSAIPSYYVSKEAKKYVSVILNGDGADELFGGYRRYVPSANGFISLASKFSFLLKFMQKPNNKKSIYNYLYRLLAMSNKTGLDFYLSSTTDIFEDEYKFKDNYINREIDSFINDVKLDSLSKMLYLDFDMILFSDLLVKIDIATMSQSLEGRSPFLSKYLLEFAPTLKNNYKIKGKSTKYVLRELSKKYLSKQLLNQPKRGFEVPLKKWVNVDLRENIFDSLCDNSYSEEFIEKKFIHDLLENKINVSDEKRVKMLWTMYCLEVWKKNQ